MAAIRDLHEKAMDLTEQAIIARHRGEIEEAQTLFQRALELEKQAAEQVSVDRDNEPTRSILYRSAATLALDCNLEREAEKLAAKGLAGSPPDDIADELRDILDKVRQRTNDFKGGQHKSKQAAKQAIAEEAANPASSKNVHSSRTPSNGSLEEEVASAHQRIAELEEKLKRLRAEPSILRTLIDHMPDYIYVKDAESKYILSNPADVRPKGLTSQDEVLDKTDYDFFPEEIAARLFNDEQEIIKTGKPLVDHEELIVDRTTGAGRWLSTTKVPWVAEGQIRGIIGIGRDITARRTLHNITLEIASQLTGESLLDLIVDRAVALLDATNGGIYRYHPEEEVLRLVASKDLPEVLGDIVKVGEGIAGLLVQTGKPYIYVSDYNLWSGRIEKHARTDRLGAELAVLLNVGNEIIGVLYVTAPAGREFTRLDRDILRELGAQAAVAIRNATLFAEIQRQNTELRSLDEFAFNIVADVSLGFRLNAIVDAAIKLLDGSGGKIYLLNETHDRLVLAAVEGRLAHTFEPGETIALMEGTTGALVRSGEPYMIENSYTHSPYRIERLIPYISALIEVPLMIGDETIGVLAVYSHQQKRVFSEGRDTEILTRLARQAALAIHDARLVEDARRRLRDLVIVQDIVQTMSEQSDTDQALETIVTHIRDNLDCNRCTIFLAEKQHGEIVLMPRKTSGVQSKHIMQLRFREGEGIAGHVFQTGESVILADATKDPNYVLGITGSERPRSMIASPVRRGKAIIGVITADQYEHSWFSNDDLRLLDTVAGHASIALALDRARRTKVFIGYSHQDKMWVDRMLAHLKPLEDKGILIWTDQQIQTGANWVREIKDAIKTTQIAILLVSPHFVASDFIRKHELRPLFEAAKRKEVIIFWIALGSSAYEQIGLADIQCANDPQKPLISLPQAEQEKVLTRIGRELEIMLN